MKIKSSLAIFCIFLILVNVFGKHKKMKAPTKTAAKTPSASVTQTPTKASSSSTTPAASNKAAITSEVFLKDYFWVQRFYPGKDPIDNLRQSEFSPQTMYFQLTNNALFFSKSVETKEDIEDFITISDLFDSKIDDPSKGKCCSRVVYKEYPENAHAHLKSAHHKCEHKKEDDHEPSDNSMKKNNHAMESANKCLDLSIPDEARWRICSNNREKIANLHTQILFNILSAKLKNKPNEIANMLANVKAEIDSGAQVEIGDWNWEEQDKWAGKCNNGIMQSPINIYTDQARSPSNLNLSITHHLEPVHTLIKKNQEESIVTFINFGGVLQFSIDSTYLLFTPTYMSFRFPGEHLFNGERKNGEILIHFTEITSLKKTASTNGLILSIPLEASTEALSEESLEQLNLDFWKYELERHATYTPKNLITKELLSFDLPALIKKISEMNPNYFLYLGSQVTPPCVEQTYHLVVDKPLVIAGCQFKVIRENSLLTNKVKTVHARVEQPLNDRAVYLLSSDDVRYTQSTGQYPQSFNKYLMMNGYKYKTAPKKEKLAEHSENTAIKLNCDLDEKKQ